jgi:hypothetical protein
MPEYGIYPHSTPDFRTVIKPNGIVEMQLRYINKPMGYTGQWIPVKTEYDNSNSPQT